MVEKTIIINAANSLEAMSTCQELYSSCMPVQPSHSPTKREESNRHWLLPHANVLLNLPSSSLTFIDCLRRASLHVRSVYGGLLFDTGAQMCLVQTSMEHMNMNGHILSYLHAFIEHGVYLKWVWLL